MKRLLAACLLALPALVLAQTSAVPNLMSYQGHITDSAGSPVGGTGSVTRTVFFRIYDNSTGGNRLWSEQQQVTIAAGDFSVLLGAGTGISGESNPNPLHAIFDGTTRFLGITVDDGVAPAETEVTPRQQLATTGFAFRAKVAEGTTAGAITSAMIGNGQVTATQLGSNAVTAAKLGTDVGLWTVNGASTSRMSGNVGIGISNPGAPLSFNNSLANTKLAIWDDGAGSFYGMGVQANQFRFHTPGSGDRFSFLAGPAGAEVFTVMTAGRVGINNPSPAAALSLYTGDSNTRVSLQTPGTGTTLNDGLALIQSDRGYLWQYENQPLLIGTNALTRMFIGTNGWIGIGTETPGSLLSLGGSLGNTKLSLWDNGGGGFMGLGVQGSQFRLHVNNSGDRFSFLTSTAGTEIMTLKGTGQLGIGTTDPWSLLHVHSATNDSRMYFTNSITTPAVGHGLVVGTDSAGAFFWNAENSPVRLATSSVVRLRVEADGRMNFGNGGQDGNMAYVMRSLAQGYILTLQDRNAAWSFSFLEDGTSFKKGTSGWTSLSDRRLKRDISDLSGSLERLLQLRSVTFEFNNEADGKGRHTGFIAQEVQEVFPEWVKTAPNGMLGVGPTGFESHTVQALRELRAEKDAQIAQRDAKITALEKRIQELETETNTRLAAIERRLNAGATAVHATPAR